MDQAILDKDFAEQIRGPELKLISIRRGYLEGLRQEEIKKGELPSFLPLPLDTTAETANDLVGLVFSGGGIRSATFNLGILQRLAELKILPLVDYLSTVSGGGYIGGWWTKWVNSTLKDRWGQLMPAPDQARASDEAPEIDWLRLYSNYLITRKGLLSGDMWWAITVVARNLFLNLLIVIPLLAIPILLVDLVYVVGSLGVQWYRHADFNQVMENAAPLVRAAWKWVAIFFAVAWVYFSLWYLILITARPLGEQTRRNRLTRWQSRLSVASALALGLFVLATSSPVLAEFLQNLKKAYPDWAGKLAEWNLKRDWAAVFAGGVSLLSGIYAAWKRGPFAGGQGEAGREGRVAQWVIRLAPYLFLVLLGVLLSSGMWLLLVKTGKDLNSYHANSAWFWLVIVYGVASVIYVVSYWLRPWHRTHRGASTTRSWRNWIVRIVVGPHLPLLILLLIWAVLFRIGSPHSLLAVCALLNVAFMVVVGVAWGTDPNAVSLHSFYRSRLIRAYLAASNKIRLEALKEGKEEVGEAVETDDSPLADLQSWVHGGPYHIINATLNLVGGKDISTEQRQAEVFMLAPRFCGSLRTGYRETGEYAGGIKLGAAVAISGAAANPAMGPRTSLPLAILLTIFNARLGYWIANPANPSWRQPGTLFWPRYMLRELFAQTTETTAEGSDFCYLSDGGHLENLGLYALVKRRCRFIIVSDVSADADFTFGDLEQALRMVRIDFRCEVALELDGIRKRSERDGIRCSQVQYSVGTICYPDGLRGVLVYIKSSLTGREPEDVLAYARRHEQFPHQTTADQFFDEAQFESYRRLGYHIAGGVFGRALERLASSPKLEREDIFNEVGNQRVPVAASLAAGC